MYLPAETGVGLQHDALLPAEGEQLPLDVVGVELDLVDHRHHPRSPLQLAQVRDSEVGDPDRSDRGGFTNDIHKEGEGTLRY